MSLRDQVAQALTDEVLDAADQAGLGAFERIRRNHAPMTETERIGLIRAVLMAALGPVLDAAEQPKTCGTCRHWLPTARDADVRAVCNLGVIREGLGRYPITDRDFGCILHEAQP